MMKYGYLPIPLLALAVGLISGCGGGSTGVQAVAPAGQEKLVAIAPDTADYTLFRAEGFLDNHDSHVEPIWTVKVPQGQKMGFRWVTDENHKYDASGGFHLIAFAGGEARDLGAFQKRDLKYLWASSNGDVTGYFVGKVAGETMTTLTMQ